MKLCVWHACERGGEWIAVRHSGGYGKRRFFKNKVETDKRKRNYPFFMYVSLKITKPLFAASFILLSHHSLWVFYWFCTHTFIYVLRQPKQINRSTDSFVAYKFCICLYRKSISTYMKMLPKLFVWIKSIYTCKYMHVWWLRALLFVHFIWNSSGYLFVPWRWIWCVGVQSTFEWNLWKNDKWKMLEQWPSWSISRFSHMHFMPKYYFQLMRLGKMDAR